MSMMLFMFSFFANIKSQCLLIDSVLQRFFICSHHSNSNVHIVCFHFLTGCKFVCWYIKKRVVNLWWTVFVAAASAVYFLFLESMHRFLVSLLDLDGKRCAADLYHHGMHPQNFIVVVTSQKLQSLHRASLISALIPVAKFTLAPLISVSSDWRVCVRAPTRARQYVGCGHVIEKGIGLQFPICWFFLLVYGFIMGSHRIIVY